MEKTVDYLKDFNAGDQVHFSDIIIDISYDATEDATTFLFFTEDTYEEKHRMENFAGKSSLTNIPLVMF